MRLMAQRLGRNTECQSLLFFAAWASKGIIALFVVSTNLLWGQIDKSSSVQSLPALN